MLMEFATWTIAGFVAALAEYWLGIGFGLGASLIMVIIGNKDPRLVASTVALAQLIMSPLALRSHKRIGNLSLEIKDIRRRTTILLLSVSSTISIILITSLVSKLSEKIVSKLFSMAIILLIIVLLLRESIGNKRTRHSFIISILLGSFAGFIKALIGGGYTMVMVLTQRFLGFDIRNSISLIPLIKVLPFSALILIYSLAGYINIEYLMLLTTGSLLGIPIAVRLLRKTSNKLGSRYYTYILIAILLIGALLKFF